MPQDLQRTVPAKRMSDTLPDPLHSIVKAAQETVLNRGSAEALLLVHPLGKE